MQEKFFLPTTLILCIILFISWYQFFFEATQREILNMELETRRLREVEREILELKARHGNLSSFAATKEIELDAAREFLPATIEQDKFIDELYRAADSCKVWLTEVQAGEIISSDEFQAQVLTVKTESDYVSLLNFIREIQDGRRLTRLENFLATSEDYGIIFSELSFKIFAEPIKNPD